MKQAAVRRPFLWSIEVAFSEFVFDKPLFHYTSTESFKIIAESGQMRFSRADQTNDPFEVQFVRKVLLDHLSCLHESAKTERDRLFWKQILNSYEQVSEPRRLYLCCWSTRQDSIAMWRLYGKEGKGVVFGLRPRAFSSFDCRLAQVEYLSGETEISDLVAKYAAKANSDYYGLNNAPEGLALAVRLLEVTINTKRKEWDYESEVRLSFSFNEERYDSIKEEVEEILYNRFQSLEPTVASKEVEKQYVFQEFGKLTKDGVDRSGAIVELILGPKCDWSLDEASHFLSDLGYKKFCVREADITWR
ncbi:MAG: DUF2971 domain-containing protein [Shimia thalassica]|uniref:DUF2971 domain-containing protein n=1 Tax=Shimia thalassica TaxID=1715693 RepID=UPI003297AED4